MGKIEFGDLMGERDYSGQRAYNQSKLANVMFTYELGTTARDHRCHREHATSGDDQHGFRRGGPCPHAMAPVVLVARPFMRSAKKGAETVVYLCQLIGG